MGKALLKIGLLLVGLAAAAGLAFVIFVTLRWERTFDVAQPAIDASTEKKVLKRGEYLVNAAAACSACHVRPQDLDKVRAGGLGTLAGGRVLEAPLGTIRVPNLTPHDTGIGRRSDGEVARLLRFNVRHDGRVAFPLMEYQGLSDGDLRAIVSYLRSLEGVANAVPASEYTFFGKVVFALVLEPVHPDDVGSRAPEPGSRQYGEYLAKFVSVCVTCHTQRKALGGEYEGALFAGGFAMPDERDPEDGVIMTPNLTPDPETGVMTQWTEKDFIKRFRTAKPGAAGSSMPWGPYSRMSDDDLKALYRYLSSLNPVKKPG